MAQTREETLKKYYEKNKAAIKERQKIYNAKPEVMARHNEKQKVYYQKTKPEPKVVVKFTEEQIKASRQITIRKYYLKNKEKLAISKEKWRKNNPGLYARYCAKRRVIKLGNGVFRITARDISRQLHHQNHECFWCGKKLGEYEMDHVIPVSKGGRHSIGNIVLSCQPCNGSKSNKFPSEFKLFNLRVNSL